MFYLSGLFKTITADYAFIISAVLFLCACFIFVRVYAGGYSALTIKMIATISIIIAATYGILCVKFKSQFLFIILGLVFSLIGDIFLDLKVIDRKNDRYHTNVGMVAFGIAHIMYLVSIIGLSNSKATLWIPAVVAISISLAVSSLIMLVLSKPLKLNFGKYFWQSYIYSFILIFMTAFSIYIAFLIPNMWIFALGLGLFLLSDLVLSTQYFGDKLDNKFLIIVNHALYYVAQVAICSVIFFV